jgi:DNA repair exonuclease SbcCD ATPase subunit
MYPVEGGRAMRLERLTLKNFKGIREFTLEPEGKDLSIFGANATGKTTLADASQWLLFGKDSNGKTDFEVLPLGPDGKRVAGITEASVEVELDLDTESNRTRLDCCTSVREGMKVVLKKVYREVWTKKRGRAEQELTGHTVDYFINGVPTKMADYQGFIRGLMDEEKFRLLTNPRYFNEILKWQDRRKIITGIDGQISDADVIASEPELFALTEPLNGRTVDDFRKVVEAEARKTNGELDKLPIRIDEAQRGLPSISEATAGDAALNLEPLRQERSGKASLLAQMDSGGGIAEKTKALREIEGQITDLDNRHRQAVGREISEAQGNLDKANSDVRRLERDLLSWRDDIDMQEERIKANDQSLQVLADAWEKATDEAFRHTDVTSCYACGQDLPTEKVQAAHDKAEASFNLAKSQKIEGIEREGNAAKELRQKAEKAKAQALALKEQTEKQLAATKAALPDLQTKVADLQAKQNQPSPDPERHKLADRILGIQAEIEDLKRGQNTTAKSQLQTEITTLDESIARIEKAKATVDQRTKGLARIEELKAEQKRLGKAYEELEHQRSLCEKFVVSKAKAANDRVNALFPTVRFKTYEIQINGGVNDQLCEATVNGVPYSDLNNAAKINAGLEILDVLSDIYGMTAPVFIDNSEAVCEITRTKAQQIRLYVSASDPVLRVESGEKVLARA